MGAQSKIKDIFYHLLDRYSNIIYFRCQESFFFVFLVPLFYGTAEVVRGEREREPLNVRRATTRKVRKHKNTPVGSVWTHTLAQLGHESLCVAFVSFLFKSHYSLCNFAWECHCLVTLQLNCDNNKHYANSYLHHCIGTESYTYTLHCNNLFGCQVVKNPLAGLYPPADWLFMLLCKTSWWFIRPWLTNIYNWRMTKSS